MAPDASTRQHYTRDFTRGAHSPGARSHSAAACTLFCAAVCTHTAALDYSTLGRLCSRASPDQDRPRSAEIGARSTQIGARSAQMAPGCPRSERARASAGALPQFPLCVGDSAPARLKSLGRARGRGRCDLHARGDACCLLGQRSRHKRREQRAHDHHPFALAQ
jgi:hypothetical protein